MIGRWVVGLSFVFVCCVLCVCLDKGVCCLLCVDVLCVALCVVFYVLMLLFDCVLFVCVLMYCVFVFQTRRVGCFVKSVLCVVWLFEETRCVVCFKGLFVCLFCLCVVVCCVL